MLPTIIEVINFFVSVSLSPSLSFFYLLHVLENSQKLYMIGIENLNITKVENVKNESLCVFVILYPLSRDNNYK